MAKPTKAVKVRARKGVDPIPEGFHTVTPYLALNGASEAIGWYARAFGAVELERRLGPGGLTLHARLKIGDSLLMLSDIFPGSPHRSALDLGTSPVTLHLYAEDVNALWERAVAAGAKVLFPLADQFWGERYGQLVDPFGHHWSLASRKEILSEEEHARRAQAWAQANQAQGTPPT